MSRVLKENLVQVIGKRTPSWNYSQDPQYIYRIRHKGSKYLDTKYLSQLFEIYELTKVFSETFYYHRNGPPAITDQAPGVKMNIELYYSQKEEVVKIGAVNKMVDIKNDSTRYRFLKELQFTDFKKSPVTLLKSLELAKIINKEFGMYNSLSSCWMGFGLGYMRKGNKIIRCIQITAFINFL